MLWTIITIIIIIIITTIIIIILLLYKNIGQVSIKETFDSDGQMKKLFCWIFE